MKTSFHKLIAAAAFCAVCAVTAVPASAADGTKLTLDQFVGLARLVYNESSAEGAATTLGDVLSKTVEKTGSVDEITAALAAAVVAREDADSGALFQAIVDAAGDDAGRAAATLLTVTAATGTVPSLEGDTSIFSEGEAAALTDLYKKVLAALRPDKYAMKEDRDKTGAGLGAPATDDQTGTKKGDGTTGDGTTGGGDTGTTGGGDTGTTGGGDTGTTGGGDTGTTGGGDTGTTGGGDTGTTGGGTTPTEGTGDDTGDTTDAIDEFDNDPYEIHTTPTTLSGSGIYIPGIHSPTTTRPVSPSRPSRPVRPVTPTTEPSPTPVGLR